MIRQWVRFCRVAVAVCVGAGTLGCETVSHRSLQIYEYTDDVPPERSWDKGTGSEYQMQSPGEMIPPETMVPPQANGSCGQLAAHLVV